MDSINIEKYQAMKRCNKYNSSFISSLVHCFLSLVMLALFLSSPIWLPTLCSSIKLFFIESFPKIIDIVLGPKCLFLVFNLIIIFLVGESRFSGSSSKPDIYEEYVTHSQGLKGMPSSENKGNDEVALVSPVVEDKEENNNKEDERENDEVEEVKEEEEEERENDEVEEVKEEEEEREERGLPTEELNKRVEAFIARVNMQRRFEARMLVCCR